MMATGFKDYDAFFADVKAEGAFKCFAYPDDVKKGIVNDLRRVFGKVPDDPLAPFVDDIVGTAQLREVRVFPKNEMMYVRAEVRLRGASGEFGEQYQFLALWDCCNVLRSYTFVRGSARASVFPKELTVLGDSES